MVTLMAVVDFQLQWYIVVLLTYCDLLVQLYIGTSQYKLHIVTYWYFFPFIYCSFQEKCQHGVFGIKKKCI